jgi:hypothetical protein
MTAVAAIGPADTAVDPVAIFRERCEARAYLVATGELELHFGVDELQRAAQDDGLIESIGQDGVQAIMSVAFNMGRRP